MGDYGVNGSGARPRVENGVNITPGLTRALRRGIKFLVKWFPRTGDPSTAGGVADGICDSVMAEMLVAARHSVTAHSMRGIIAMQRGATGTSGRGGVVNEARGTKPELAGVNKGAI